MSFLQMVLGAAVVITVMIFPAQHVRAFQFWSCSDNVAASFDKPMTSPECIPVILASDKATEFLKEMNAKKIKGKWFIFITKKEFAEGVDYKLRWKSIANFVSAVQSLFNEKADCFIARFPETDEEKTALLEGNYPQNLIAAEGRFAKDEAESNVEKWPEYHHHLKYILTVY